VTDPKKNDPLTLAEADHRMKVAAVKEAEAQLQAASESKLKLGARILDAEDAEVDKLVAQSIQADVKVEAMKRRLAVAQEREAVAAEAVRAASIEDTRAELAKADEQLAQDDAAVVAFVRNVLDTASPLLARLFEEKSQRDILANKLTDQPPRVTSPAVSALKVTRVTGKEALKELRSTGVLPGVTVDVHATLMAIIEHIRAEPARKAAAVANAQDMADRRAAALHARHLAGTDGPELRDAAVAADRAAFAAAGTLGTPSVGSDGYAAVLASRLQFTGEA
jgi:hypothetical protein